MTLIEIQVRSYHLIYISEDEPLRPKLSATIHLIDEDKNNPGETYISRQIASS